MERNTDANADEYCRLINYIEHNVDKETLAPSINSVVMPPVGNTAPEPTYDPLLTRALIPSDILLNRDCVDLLDKFEFDQTSGLMGAFNFRHFNFSPEDTEKVKNLINKIREKIIYYGFSITIIEAQEKKPIYII